MQLKEVMTPSVEVITPEATIQAAAEKMSNLDIGLLPVCEGERLVGIVTDRDIPVRAVAEGRGPVTTQVGEVMTPDAIYGFDDQDVEEAARLVEQYQIRCLPVLNRHKQLVGMVSLGTSPYILGSSHWRARCLSRSRSREACGGRSQEPLARVSVTQDLLSRGCRVIEHEDRRRRYDPTDPCRTGWGGISPPAVSRGDHLHACGNDWRHGEPRGPECHRVAGARLVGGRAALSQRPGGRRRPLSALCGDWARVERPPRGGAGRVSWLGFNLIRGL